jgi:hypothetical protein
MNVGWRGKCKFLSTRESYRRKFWSIARTAERKGERIFSRKITIFNTMKIQRFPFKNLFLCFTLGMFPLAALTALLSLLNLVPIYFNDTPYYGFVGCILSLMIAPFFGFIVGSVSYLFLNLGCYIYNLAILPMMKNANRKTD